MAFYDTYAVKLRDALQDSPLIIEMKSRFSNLEPKQQQLIAVGSAAAILFLVLSIPLSLLITTASLESQAERMEDDALYLNQIDAEISELERAISAQGSNVDTTVTPATPAREAATRYLQQANVQDDAYTLQDGAEPNSVTVQMKQATLSQVRRVLFSLENSPAGIDVFQFDVNMKPEAKGYMLSTIGFRKREVAVKPEAAKPAKKAFTR